MLEFRSSNQTHRPVIEALALVARNANAGNTTYYPLGETVPVHKAMGGDWAEVVHRVDKRGRRRVVRMVYEVVAFQALRDQLKCKEIWVVGADKWRNPDEDLPQDFEARRAENYRELRKPLDPAVFVNELREQMTAELALLNDQMPKLSWLDIAERKSGAIRLTAAEAQPGAVQGLLHAGHRYRCGVRRVWTIPGDNRAQAEVLAPDACWNTQVTGVKPLNGGEDVRTTPGPGGGRSTRPAPALAGSDQRPAGPGRGR